MPIICPFIGAFIGAWIYLLTIGVNISDNEISRPLTLPIYHRNNYPLQRIPIKIEGNNHRINRMDPHPKLISYKSVH